MSLGGSDQRTEHQLRRKFEPAAESYWIARAPAGPAPDTFKNQF
jgi:hypothetical protein